MLRSDIPETGILPASQRYNAKIVRLHATRRGKTLQTHDHDKMEGDESSFFHVLKMLRRWDGREIRHIQDLHGNTYTRPTDIVGIFVAHLRQKYGPIDPETQSLLTP